VAVVAAAALNAHASNDPQRADLRVDRPTALHCNAMTMREFYFTFATEIDSCQ